jgi:hypothetical protein
MFYDRCSERTSKHQSEDGPKPRKDNLLRKIECSSMAGMGVSGRFGSC